MGVRKVQSQGAKGRSREDDISDFSESNQENPGDVRK